MGFESPLNIGLSSWVIQDDNYQDFLRGDRASFALEFHAPSGMSVEIGRDRTQFDHLRDSTYQIAAKIIHVRDREWWAIDAGILVYEQGRMPLGAEEGALVYGEAYVGVDPF